MSFTEAQCHAIRAETHLLIEAGAGSGKTTTLVAKIMHALGAEVLSGERAARPCELGDVAAITFTEAAAADLRAALRKALRTEAARSGDPLWRRRLYALERARIGTIHSFCGDLLREWGERSDVEPGFRIVDQTQSTLLRREIAHRVLLDHLASGDPAGTALAAELGVPETRTEIERVMADAARARLVRERWCPGGTPRLDDARAAVAAAGMEWRAHDEQAQHHAALLLELGLRAHDRLRERLAADGAIDFDGLIDGAHRLLHAGAELLDRLRGRIRWLFVDEFQDTDVLQKEIAYRLCGLDDTGDTRDATATAPRLCIVGDPKQSIYRFRRADVSVWNTVADDFAARALPVISLDVNFRGRAPLLAYVNATFAPLMDPGHAPPELAHHEVRYAPLRAARDLPGDDDLVEILAVEEKGPDGKKINADEQRAAEAARVAARIRQLVAGECCVEERDRDGVQRFRAPRYRDVALLFRSTTSLPIYEDALRRAGIPYYVAAGSGFFARREVRDLLLLLRALADPRDDIAWAGLLRAPWVGLRDESILRLRRAAPNQPLSAALGTALDGGDAERLPHAREWLAELRFLRDRVRPMLLLERALERSGYAECLLLHDDGERALANLRKLVRMADGAGVCSTTELADWLREREEVAGREAEARLHTAGEDVVVLTTVHAAKGLEWPVVFLCDLAREMNSSGKNAPRLMYQEECGLALDLREPDAPDDGKTGAWLAMEAREKTLSRAEEKRVWYVAATRARDRLVLSGCVLERSEKDAATSTGDAKCAAQWLLSALTLASDQAAYGAVDARRNVRVHRRLRAGTPQRAPRAAPTIIDLDGAPALPAAVQLALGALPPVRSRRRRSATELMRFAHDPHGHRRAYELGLPPLRFIRAEDDPRIIAPDTEAPARALDPRQVGNIVHGVLEKLRDDADLAQLLDAEINAELGEGAASGLPDEARAHLRAILEQTWSHPLLAPLYDGGLAEPELPFTWLLGGGAAAPVALRGAMDLVGFIDGAPEIVDFKTHAVQPGQEPEVARRYELQRQAYAAALTELLGQPPRALRFFFPATRAEASTPLDAGDLAAAQARVREMVERIGAE